MCAAQRVLRGEGALIHNRLEPEPRKDSLSRPILCPARAGFLPRHRPNLYMREQIHLSAGIDGDQYPFRDLTLKFRFETRC